MPSIDMQPHERGTLLAVHAQPRARRAGIGGVHDDALKVCVTVPAEGGKANKAIAEVLARSLAVPRSRVVLVGGTRARHKRFLVEGLAPEVVRERLARWIDA